MEEECDYEVNEESVLARRGSDPLRNENLQQQEEEDCVDLDVDEGGEAQLDVQSVCSSQLSTHSVVNPLGLASAGMGMSDSQSTLGYTIGGHYSDHKTLRDEIIATLQVLSSERLPPWKWQLGEDTVTCVPSFDPPRKTGPRLQAPLQSEASYFDLFFDDRFMEQIARWTNLNAEKKIRENPTNNKMKWTDTSVEEMRAFFGVVMVIERYWRGTYAQIWSEKHHLIDFPGIKDVFPRDRFMQIIRYLHFCNEEEALRDTDPEYDRLYKVRQLLHHVVCAFQREYTPVKELSVDECMIPYLGRLTFKQYCKDKPVKWGLKAWMLCESKTGYAYNIDIYVGRDLIGDSVDIGLATRVVVQLVHPLANSGYEVYTDRFYTSPLLLYYLYLLGSSGCGTVMTNRRNFPTELTDEVEEMEMERGDSIFATCATTGMTGSCWQDKRKIYMLSNCHVPEVEGLTIQRKDKRGRKEDIPCIPAVVQYNNFMGGVDKNDQMARLDHSRKSPHWYHKIFRKCLQWASFNSYVIAKSLGEDHEYPFFYLQIAHQLVGAFTARVRRPLSKVAVEGENVLQGRLIPGDHFLEVKDEEEKDQGNCVVCAKRRKLNDYEPRRRSIWTCTSPCVDCMGEYFCNVSNRKCFQLFHTKKEFWRN